MKYKCKPCKFETDRKTDLDRHFQTNKHKENNKTADDTSNQCKCPYCGNTYSTQGNCTKHMKSCIKKEIDIIIKEKDNIITNIIIENLKKELQQKEKENEKLQQQVNDLINKEKKVPTKSSVTFITNNYYNAPKINKIDQLTDCSTMKNGKNLSFINRIKYHYDNGTLQRFVGDFIVKNYKKDDPSQQSVWNSDISRLTYIINVMKWEVDKRGIKLIDYAIKPVLQYLDDEITNYTLENSMKTGESILLKMQKMVEILQIIRNGTLADKINKYIAPYFSLNPSNEQMLQIKDGKDKDNNNKKKNSKNSKDDKGKEELYDSVDEYEEIEEIEEIEETEEIIEEMEEIKEIPKQNKKTVNKHK